jgi:hypothetical protein
MCDWFYTHWEFCVEMFAAGLLVYYGPFFYDKITQIRIRKEFITIASKTTGSYIETVSVGPTSGHIYVIQNNIKELKVSGFMKILDVNGVKLKDYQLGPFEAILKLENYKSFLLEGQYQLGMLTASSVDSLTGKEVVALDSGTLTAKLSESGRIEALIFKNATWGKDFIYTMYFNEGEIKDSIAIEVYANDRIVFIKLADGRIINFPADRYELLKAGTDAQLQGVVLRRNGEAMRWEELDEDLTVAGILRGDFRLPLYPPTNAHND